MKRLGVLVAAIAAAATLWPAVSRSIPATIEYRGQQIKLSRFYLSYESYKDDPDNVDASENARVARLVESAPMGRSFDSRLEMTKAVFAIRFPGYGVSSFGVPPSAGGVALAAFSIEVPRAGKERVFVFEGRGERYTLLDDFLADGTLAIARAAVRGDALVFSSMNGTVLLERPLAVTPLRDRSR